MSRALARYREFAPCSALRDCVRAFFSFGPLLERNDTYRPVTLEVRFGDGDSFRSPMFADGHVSMVFSFRWTYRLGGLWYPNPIAPNGQVIGPMSTVGPPADADQPEAIGVYFYAAQAHRFIQVPNCELLDRIVALEDLWSVAGSELVVQLNDSTTEAARIDCLESSLLDRLDRERNLTSMLDLPGLAGCVLRRRGRITVQRLAEAAGVSRQHLTRVFREAVGVTPKLYCRLARFQAGLVYAGRKDLDCAQLAVALGYFDQSHMIADFRQFTSLTPHALLTQPLFHPFIEHARPSNQGRHVQR
jgi:AraC-like DNA-binding protein